MHKGTPTPRWSCRVQKEVLRDLRNNFVSLFRQFRSSRNVVTKGWNKNFLVSPQSNSANFWGVSVRKSQIRKFVMINPQIYLLFSWDRTFKKWKLFKLIFLRWKIMYLRICGGFKSAKHTWVSKSRTANRKKYMVRKLPYLWKVRKYKQSFFKSANLWKLFADCPPLVVS